jgi:tRNA pseudouridine38-40 synthase
VRNLKLTIEYDGTDFHGWQRQPTPARTVQQVIEDALAQMTGAPVVLRGAGRTDAGVHARGQVANVRTETAIPAQGLARGLNALLPRDVAVVALEDVDPEFDARRWACGKHYRYRLWNAEPRAPLLRRTSWHIRRRLDVQAMQAAARHLLGEHDFTAFRAADCDRKNPVRNIHRLDFSQVEAPLIVLDAEATAFLKHMVRVIVGTLVEVGLGARAPDDLAAILASRDRTQAGRTAPATGLTLQRVYYTEGRPPFLG